MIVEVHSHPALGRIRLLRGVETSFEVEATTASWSVAILSAVLLGGHDLPVYDCDSSFSTDALDVNLLRILDPGIGGISFGCICVCVRIRDIRDVDMVVLSASDSRFARNTLYCQDSCLVTSARPVAPSRPIGTSLHSIVEAK